MEMMMMMVRHAGKYVTQRKLSCLSGLCVLVLTKDCFIAHAAVGTVYLYLIV